jgi:DNA-binding NarL/FixJ family response regulator
MSAEGVFNDARGVVTGMLAVGHTNTQIARRLGISERTVRTHLENIYERLDVSSRTAAVTRAFPGQIA